jgi:hypothetical protein
MASLSARLSTLSRQVAIGVCAAVLAVLGFASTAAASTPAAHPAASGYDQCQLYYFCLFNGPNGTGDMCEWEEYYNPDILDPQYGACSWISAGWKVRSDYNRHTGITIEFYKAVNYQDRIGSQVPGGFGNFSGPFTILSFRRE